MGQCLGSLPFGSMTSHCHGEEYKAATKVLDPTEYNEVVTTKDSGMIDTFSSKIIHARMKIAFTSMRLNMMTQALCAKEGSLPQGLMIQNSYTEMHNGRKVSPLW